LTWNTDPFSGAERRTVEQLGEPVNDCEPETKSLCLVAFNIPELNELMEDFMLSLQRDAEPLRVDRRLFRLSHAAMAGSSSMA
jgi:hypothetical protein